MSKNISPNQLEEILQALEQDPMPPIEWFEERLPGISEKIKEGLKPVIAEIKQILNSKFL